MLWRKIANKIQQLGFNYTTRQQLTSLSKQQLNDIGISREEAKIEADKSSISGVIKELLLELKNIKQ